MCVRHILCRENTNYLTDPVKAESLCVVAGAPEVICKRLPLLQRKSVVLAQATGHERANVCVSVHSHLNGILVIRML
jgi:hypothetical protein